MTKCNNKAGGAKNIYVFINLINMEYNQLVVMTLTFLFLFKFYAGSRVDNCDSEENILECDEVNNEKRTSCSNCLEKNPCCSWCRDPGYRNDRCGVLSKLTDQNCSLDKILIGGPSRSIELEDLELSDTDGNREAVQIKPQKIKLRLREGDNVTFSFKYRAAKNYPMQLYYLMDLTNSMKAHKESLVKIGKDLGNLLSNLTKHHQIAFGYYADKVAMPFYKMTPGDLENPCEMLYGETCSKGFAFVHAQDFTNDIDTFVKNVDRSNFTSNLDDLENGLEPIVQILQCEKHVSWLHTSRKVIVMATNSLLHMAGDGILAGVTKRHPGGCILSDDGVLNDYLAYDYPSLEEVRRALEKRKVKLILTGAVRTGNENVIPVHENYYKSLHELISDVSVFVNDREIVESVKIGYEEVTKQISFRDNNTYNYLDITYTSSCNNSVDKSAFCLDTNAGNVYDFHITVHLSDLPQGVKENFILISESNIEESLEVHLEYIVNKECDCADLEDNDCNGHGSFKCGQCECYNTWYDANCSRQCTVDNCRLTNATYTSTTCSSKGECDFDACKCVCDDDVSGDFCEEKNCKKDSNGLICAGHGACKNGECQCNSQYKGDICDCSTSIKNCYKDKGEESDNVTICGGHGECVCNKCVCQDGEETIIDDETKEKVTQIVKYVGGYCQYCLNCTHTCSKYKNCITANVENMAKEAYCDKSFPPQIENSTREYGEDACTGEYYNTNNQLCSVSFILQEDVILYRDNGCSGVQAAGIYYITIPLLILLLGILGIILWKVHTVRMDRREVAKFEKERDEAGYQMSSPLYKDPVSRFRNPMYPDNSYN